MLLTGLPTLTKKKTKRNRSNFAFISLSVFVIEVTLLSVPLDEIYWFYMKDLQFQWFIAVTFFIEFPFSFSCLITIVMAVDRVFAITLAQKYENIVTLKTLQVITIILLLLSVARNSITFWSMLYILASKFWVFHVGVADLILKVATPVVVILAHLYVLNFALKRRDLKQLRIHHHKNHNSRRLTKTIICICISQLIFAFPHLIHSLFWAFSSIHTADPLSFTILNVNINAWLRVLRYCQCFSNAIIILLNQKQLKISKPIDKEQPIRNNKPRMKTRM